MPNKSAEMGIKVQNAIKMQSCELIVLIIDKSNNFIFEGNLNKPMFLFLLW